MKTFAKWALQIVFIIVLLLLAFVVGYLWGALVCSILGPTVLVYSIVILGMLAFIAIVSAPILYVWNVFLVPMALVIQEWLWDLFESQPQLETVTA